MTPRGSITQTDENLHYLVMEYVDGGTLEKYCSPSSSFRWSASLRSSLNARVRSNSRTSDFAADLAAAQV